MNTELMHYNTARKALAQARRIDEVKDIHDKARAVATYAKLANDHELLGDAVEIRMRAEIRGGELLAEMKVRGERHQGDNKQNLRGSRAVTPVAPKLSDLGVSKMQSSRWQKLAKLSKPDQERRIKNAKEATGKAIEKAEKGNRKTHEKKPSDTDDNRHSYQLRLMRKIRSKIVDALESLIASERNEFLELLEAQLKDLKRK